MELRTADIDQWFLRLLLGIPSPAHLYVSLSHLIQLISSLVETARPEVGVSDIARHTKCTVLGVLYGEVSKTNDID